MSGKFYWLRLKRDFFKRHDIRIIEAMPNGKDYILFYLKLLCESVDHEGNLRFSEQIPYSPDMLATITDTNPDIVKNAINLFTELGMMDILDDGTYFMSEVEKMIGSAADNPAANRQRRYRECKAYEALPEPKTENVTQALQNVTPPVTENHESKSKSKSKSKSIELDIEREVEREKKAQESPPPYEEILQEYNEICTKLPRATILNDRRRKAIKTLCSNKDIGRANISLAFQRAQESDFLSGKNKRGWTANFDWIMNPTNIVKILEGNYDSGSYKTYQNIARWAEEENE